MDIGAGIRPAGLAEAGGRRLALARFYKCRQDNLSDRNKYLQALGEQLQAGKLQLQADVASYQQRIAAAQAASGDYRSTCQVQGLSQVQYQACLQRSQQLNQEIAQINQVYQGLQLRNTEQNSRITAFDSEVSTIPGSMQAAYQEYQAAVREQEHWLDVTRGLIAAPANQGMVTRADCPSVQGPPATLPEMDAMTEALIACLRRMPETALVPPPRVPRVESASNLAVSGGLDSDATAVSDMSSHRPRSAP
ncbi:MAG TPA: hypothetical protein VLV87_07925 [Gammaproteobacteria bacterium]|nr:hypothetical protein [Gammaproteobacteria bacterium]